ncbi:MAG: DUF411 domain-containing protein [Burkholderiaceae bacterium]
MNIELPRQQLVRRQLILSLLLSSLWTPATRLRAEQSFTVDVWKSPTCGCCKDWVAHLKDNGFRVTTHDTGNSAMREKLGMPRQYGSCHTARVGGYVIEGHVPAADVIRLLKDRPRAVGLAVPGMPVGSPGMDGPAYDGQQDAYDVVLVKQDNTASIFQAYPGK